MTNEEVELYFGNLHKACRMLNIAHTNMTKWKKKGYIPYLQQFRIAELTEGALMPDEVDPKLGYMKRNGTCVGKRPGVK